MSEQNNRESKTGSTAQVITVNVVYTVTTLVGLALISNHLLDKANAANDRGLSVDKHIEKAKRNDESYAQQYNGLTRIGWFGTDYDCSNNAVVEEVREYVACRFLMTCSGAGFTDFKQVAKLDSAGISRWFEAYQRREIENGTAKTINPTEAELRWGRNTIAKIADDQRLIYNTFSKLFNNARVMTDDVNPATKKYLCRMTFNYDSSMVLPWYDYVTRTNLLRNKGFMAGVNASLQKNPDFDMVDTTTQVWLRTNSIEQKAASNPPATATYTVQPSSDGRFSVDISHVTLPGGD
jgi:hypothetical protein